MNHRKLKSLFLSGTISEVHNQATMSLPWSMWSSADSCYKFYETDGTCDIRRNILDCSATRMVTFLCFTDCDCLKQRLWYLKVSEVSTGGKICTSWLLMLPQFIVLLLEKDWLTYWFTLTANKVHNFDIHLCSFLMWSETVI